MASGESPWYKERRKPLRLNAEWGGSFLCSTVAVSAQIPATDPLLRDTLAPVTVTAARLPAPVLRLPYAVGMLNQTQIQRGQAQLSLHESLISLPGLHAQNPANFAQDLRLSVRGFGARSAFGIRGLRLLVDGLPESTPDGQADVDNIDAGALRSIELLRGTSAGLYGNASGGVLNIQTEEPSLSPFAEIRSAFGSFGFQRIQSKGSMTIGKMGLSASLSHHRIQGYRPQSAMRQTILNLKSRFQFNASTRLSLLVNAGSSPLAQDAGGLTAEQVSTNRRQVREANVQFDAGEKVAQGRIGFVLEKNWSEKRQLTAKAYLTARDFANRLAFQNSAWVAFGRLFGGGAVQYAFQGRQYRSQMGLETNHQRDHRYRFDNLEGEKGPLRLEQNERFHSTGLFWVQEWTPLKKWAFTTAARLDRLDLQVHDLFLSDGDQSGRKTFRRFSPMAGIVFLPSPAFSVYANLASHFEAPTLTELSANPSNLGGFNPDVKPQTSLHGEMGLKTAMDKPAALELALFYIALRNELAPYQLPPYPGRVFYRNAGKIPAPGTRGILPVDTG
ncbi:MAG: TonB-dependent receptor [Haliscomenobacter sp.]|nr:TonB-dependent receptor [Haliscomenobacter sp.]